MKGMSKILVGVYMLASFCAFFSCMPGFVLAQEALEAVIVDGDEVNYDAATNTVKAEGNVVIEYKNIKVTCDKANVNTLHNIGDLYGNVQIEHDGGVMTGDNIRYNFNTQDAEFKGVYLESDPFYAYGEAVNKVSDDYYQLKDACVTTCGPLDGKKFFMDYTINAKEIEFYPQEKVVAKNVVVKVGKMPLMYIPYYVQPSKDKLPRVTLVPGYDSPRGVFLLTAWRYYVNQQFRGRLHLDWHSKKGMGVGFTHKHSSDKLGEGVYTVYYVGDRDRQEFDEPYDFVGGDRYKVQLRHKYQNDNGLSATFQLYRFSDEHFLKDYFYKEYEKDTDPESYALLTQSVNNGSLSLLTQKRVNSFYNQVEYLPRLRYKYFKKRIGESDFYFDSVSEYASLQYQYAKPTEADYDVSRFDTLNTLSYQKKFAWLNVNPYLRLRETYYSSDKLSDEDLLRTQFSTGVELSTKLYKAFSPDFSIGDYNINGLRHIVTPILGYSYKNQPSVSNAKIDRFDSIDHLTYGNTMSFRLENKLKAKGENAEGEDKVWDLLYFAPQVNYRFNQESRGGSNLTTAKYDLEIRPWENLYFEQEAIFDLDNLERVTEVTSDINFKSQLVDLAMGHRYLRDDESQLTSDFMYRFAPKWHFQTYLRYDDNVSKFEKQGFYLGRELNCWDMELGFTIDAEYEKTIWLVFKLKAFPELGFHMKETYASPNETN